MELDTSPLQPEIDKILEEEIKRPFYQWDCYLRIRKPNPIDIGDAIESKYALDEEKENIFRPFNTSNIDFIRDYEQNMADSGSIILSYPMGVWYKVLQPYRDYLELVLKRIPKKEKDRTTDPDQEEQTEVFYAMPKLDPATIGQGSLLDRYDRDDLDIRGIVDIEFQLMDLSIEKLRAVTIGGIFRQVVPADVIRGVIAKESEKITLGDDGPAVTAIKFYEADNKEKREHILLPQGMSLNEVPFYVQRHCGGVYSTGISSYLQNKEWYIFPPYNTKRFPKEDKTLTVIRLASMAYDEAERTYRMDGDRLIVMGNSDSNFEDKGDQEFKSDGNGVRFADGRFYMMDLVKTHDNKAVASRGKINHEYLFKEYKVGDTPNNSVNTSDDRIHANPFFENTRLSMREGNVYMFQWKNSDASLLYPGMPTKILYLRNKEVEELHGVLLKVHRSDQLMGKGITSKNYRQTSALFIYATKPEKSESS